MELITSSEEASLQRLNTLIKESNNEVVIKSTEDWEDGILLMFLRCRNLDVESAFERISGLVTCSRATHRDVFEEAIPIRLKSVFEGRAGDILKNRDNKGRRILVYKYSYWDPEIISIADAWRAIILIAFQLLQEKETQENGIVAVVDASDFTFKKASYCTPGIVRKFAGVIINANPIKLKAVHILNAPRIYNVILSIVRLVAPKKLTKRIHLHGSKLEKLHESIDPNILPISLGGILSEEQAIDQNFIPAIFSRNSEIFYNKILANYKTCHS